MVATVVAVRFAWTFVVGALPRLLRARLGRADGPPWVEVLLVAFTGMRGAVSVAAALAIPLTTDAGDPLPGRDLIIFLTYVVVVVTVVGQGLALPRLLRRIAPEGPGDQVEREEDEARVAAARAALEHLDELGTTRASRTARCAACASSTASASTASRRGSRVTGATTSRRTPSPTSGCATTSSSASGGRSSTSATPGASPTTPCGGWSTTSTSTSPASR